MSGLSTHLPYFVVNIVTQAIKTCKIENVDYKKILNLFFVVYCFEALNTTEKQTFWVVETLELQNLAYFQLN